MTVLVGSHAVNDLYQGAVPAVVPFLVAERSYGYVAAAGITLAATVLSSVVQPLFGFLTDRRAMPWLVPAGMTVAGAGIGLCGLGDSYLFTWLAIALSGLGVAAYHPEAARLARRASRDSHVGMSWFALGGNAGFALGPVLVTPVLAFGGLAATPLLMIPALIGGALTLALRGVQGEETHVAVHGGRDDWGQFGRLTVVIIARSMATFGLSTFLAIWVAHRVGGLIAGSLALVVLFGAGAAGTLLGGVLAGRWGRIRTVRVSYAVAVPAVAGIALVPGPAVYLMVAIAAVALYAPFSLHTTLGQDYLPTRLGTASGVTLGLAVSVGGVAAPAVGAIAAATNLQQALLLLAVLPGVAWAAARGLRTPARSMRA
ncbi:MFS transporter [Lentzea flava]|uniref:MFS transporter n=1 Tax=Lentzea flava TaxID=103732 RepID=A0ABQ2UVL2_9PSEU|nr:MFS transporter, FSR family, fosmidomycin resistance protein [Lentzea flava]GGU54995.1 MFS transporter [Lentzea flava]